MVSVDLGCWLRNDDVDMLVFPVVLVVDVRSFSELDAQVVLRLDSRVARR
jgi:hypothetical protein